MGSEETQKEELEVLQSIYDGDESFKQMSGSKFQYKYGEDGDYKSFIVEITWPTEYPDVLPEINLDLFYNKHILPQVKDTVRNALVEQASDLLGMSMTFSLFEWVKDNLDTLLLNQPDTSQVVPVVQKEEEEEEEETSGKKETKEKKEQLTKSQKRRIFDRFGAVAERPRGWDWVDIIKHLSQTGGQRLEES